MEGKGEAGKEKVYKGRRRCGHHTRRHAHRRGPTTGI